jgi:hypothetical protein
VDRRYIHSYRMNILLLYRLHPCLVSPSCLLRTASLSFPEAPAVPQLWARRSALPKSRDCEDLNRNTIDPSPENLALATNSKVPPPESLLPCLGSAPSSPVRRSNLIFLSFTSTSEIYLSYLVRFRLVSIQRNPAPLSK